MLTKEQILNCDDLKLERVEVPEWGGDVFVRTLSGKERDQIDSFIVESKKDSSYPGFRALLCAFSICDENGTSLFTRADLEALEQKNAVVLQRIFDAALRLNGMSAEEARRKKETFQGESL